MARTRRIVVPAAPHHVIARGNNRRILFSRSTDYLRFISCLSAALGKTGCLLHALSLQPNHAHLLLTPPDATSLGTLMQRCCQRYAQYRNAKRKATGKLFEQRYVSRSVLEAEYMATVTLYIDLNAWKDCRVLDPADHPWSTYGLHAGRGCRPKVIERLWTPSGWYMGLGDCPDDREARYRELAAQIHESPEEGAGPSRESYSLRLERPDRRRAS
jgi:putative transposase